MNTLVAAPTCPRKSYAFDEWAAATASYDRLLSVAEDEADYGDELTERGFRVVVYPELKHLDGDGISPKSPTN
jgi:NAD-dependent dihydropyrimidine dehydrogenase PreA subunit